MRPLHPPYFRLWELTNRVNTLKIRGVEPNAQEWNDKVNNLNIKGVEPDAQEWTYKVNVLQINVNDMEVCDDKSCGCGGKETIPDTTTAIVAHVVDSAMNTAAYRSNEYDCILLILLLLLLLLLIVSIASVVRRWRAS